MSELKRETATTVLLVDDDPHFLELMSALLEDQGTRVALATSASEALGAIERIDPDLVVSDVNMPGLRGPDFRRRLRDRERVHSRPFVFLSSMDRSSPELRHVRPLLSKCTPGPKLRRQVQSYLEVQQREEPAVGPLARLKSRISHASWPLKARGYEILKRGMDLAGSSALLLLFSPLLALLILIIKLQDGGPAFYSQERLGRGGRPFRFYKLRSMYMDADKRRDAVVSSSACQDLRFKDVRDPRITPIGRLLRRFSLDEIPQLWNVARGDMSLVGPRPPIREETDLYDTYAWRRLDVIPGLTCTWQVSGRADIAFDDQVELDLKYIHCRGVTRDLALIAQTIPAVITGRGAY